MTTGAEPRRGHLSRYRELPRLTGRAYLPIGFLARLPFSMTGLGVLTLVTTATGSVGTGGLAVAAASGSTAVLGPVQGRLADRLGQRRVLLTATALCVLGLVAVVVATATGAPTAVLLAACALAGGTAPQVSALSRARWIALTGARPSSLRTAMGYESTVDEITWVLGPALVGLIAATGRPDLTLLVAAGLAAVAGTAFALHPTADAVPAHPRRTLSPGQGGTDGTGGTGGTGSPGSQGGLAHVVGRVPAPLLGLVAMGLFFGGTQAGLTAFATALDRPGVAGLLYAVMGVGSAVTALAVVALPDRFGARARWVTFGAGMAVAASGLLVVTTAGGAAVVVLLAGLFVGPTLVTLFFVGGERAPAGQSGITMTLMSSANVVGVAAGAAAAGAIADRVGHGTAFWLPVLAAAALAVVGATSRPAPVAPGVAPGAGPAADDGTGSGSGRRRTGPSSPGRTSP